MISIFDEYVVQENKMYFIFTINNHNVQDDRNLHFSIGNKSRIGQIGHERGLHEIDEL